MVNKNYNIIRRGYQVDKKEERYLWKLRRMSKDITLREVAEAIDSDYSVLSKWERDKRDISSDIIAKYKQYIEEKVVKYQ